MLLSLLAISLLHQATHSQYDVVRLDPFRYVSPTLLVHSATARRGSALRKSTHTAVAGRGDTCEHPGW